MNIIKKMAEKSADNMNYEGVTIAFLGDSVTQGCFELYEKGGHTETVFDKVHSYEMYIFNILSVLFPSVPVNIINAGISGDTAENGAKRIERDIIRHQPDMVVVCYGLNDCTDASDSQGKYIDSLSDIFTRLSEANIETVFLTPNMMNTRVSERLQVKTLNSHAEFTARIQNDGIFDKHIEAAKKLCKKYNVTVCDCYSIWKELSKCGVDTTELLSNKINHPTREMNMMFAYELVRTMFYEGE